MSVLNRNKWVTMIATAAGPDGVFNAGKAYSVPPARAAELLEHRYATNATDADIAAAKARIADEQKRQAEEVESRRVIEIPQQLQSA